MIDSPSPGHLRGHGVARIRRWCSCCGEYDNFNHFGRLLGEAADGSAQLSDFQRGWVWDDDRVQSLFTSISLGYPIGAVMVIRAASDDVRLKQRPLEGGPTPPTEMLTGSSSMATRVHKT